VANFHMYNGRDVVSLDFSAGSLADRKPGEDLIFKQQGGDSAVDIRCLIDGMTIDAE